MSGSDSPESRLPDPLEVEVFRAGDYGPKGSYSEEDLDRLAEDYNRERHEAPVTLDHDQCGPAEGWVAGLRRMGDRLVATLHRLSPSLRRLLSAGAYKKRSVELYRRFRETGRPYLKAVSFLGAAAPEVKGLTDPAFADDGTGTVRFLEENRNATEAAEEARAEEAAGRARQTLIDAARWNPVWEQNGLLDAFREIGPGNALETVVGVLLGENGPVEFGRSEKAPVEVENDDAIAAFVGTPSPDSIERHRRALRFLARHPAASYAEALIQSERE